MSFVYVAIEKNGQVYECGLTPEHEEFFRPQRQMIEQGFLERGQQIQLVENVKFYFVGAKCAKIYVVTEDIVDDAEILAMADQLCGLGEQIEQNSDKQEVEGLIENLVVAIEGGCECEGECQCEEHHNEEEHNCKCEGKKCQDGHDCQCDKQAKEAKRILTRCSVLSFAAAGLVCMALVMRFTKSQ